MRLIVRAVGLAGVEPATSPLSGVRSNQLSYSPERVPDGSAARLAVSNVMVYRLVAGPLLRALLGLLLQGH